MSSRSFSVQESSELWFLSGGFFGKQPLRLDITRTSFLRGLRWRLLHFLQGCHGSTAGLGSVYRGGTCFRR